MKDNSKKINKLVKCIFAILLVALIGSILIFNKNSDNITLDEVKLKDVDAENSMFAIMVQQEGENYIPYDQETWPTENYTFNEDKSGCLDSEGKKIEGIALTFDALTKKVKVETDVTSYCYIYFDKKSSKAGDVIKDKVGNDGLIQTSDDTDLNYRYVGDNTAEVNNYICFGTTDKNNCTNNNGNNYMYRIIGIDDKNRLKLIKDIAISTSRIWHTVSAENAVWDSGSGKIEAELHKNLNDSIFLNNNTFVPVLERWKEKIDTNTWNIGDVNNDSYAQNGGDEIYAQEKLTLTEIPSKIGLMYLSDYYYSLDDGGTRNCREEEKEASNKCKSSWLHITNNGTSQSYAEWTMTRFGLSYSNYATWIVSSDGYVAINNLNASRAVRPVFYLKSDSVIKGGSGTSSDPYILESPEETGTRLATEKFGKVPQGFNTTPVADLYRFVGTTSSQPNNYICFGTTDNCYNNDDPKENYQYRIIGLDTSGRLKLIKDTALSTSTSWHSNIKDNAVWDTGSSKTSAQLYKDLNDNSFLNNNTYVPASGNWKDKIDETNWKIGDSNGDTATTGDAIWQWESASTATTPSKIGLMYLSDYYYSLDGEGTKNCRSDYATCKTSWLHITNNSSSQSYNEWTMSRYGVNSYGYYYAWSVISNGSVNYINLDNMRAVRPVFYLKSDVKITGEGTKSNPFLIS